MLMLYTHQETIFLISLCTNCQISAMQNNTAFSISAYVIIVILWGIRDEEIKFKDQNMPKTSTSSGRARSLQRKWVTCPLCPGS
jgi:hypothetical protein